MPRALDTQTRNRHRDAGDFVIPGVRANRHGRAFADAGWKIGAESSGAKEVKPPSGQLIQRLWWSRRTACRTASVMKSRHAVVGRSPSSGSGNRMSAWLSAMFACGSPDSMLTVCSPKNAGMSLTLMRVTGLRSGQWTGFLPACCDHPAKPLKQPAPGRPMPCRYRDAWQSRWPPGPAGEAPEQRQARSSQDGPYRHLWP